MSRENITTLWGRVPGPVRKSIIATIGGTLVALGIALVVLPGPFTLPLLAAGFAVLGTEFAWANRALQRAKAGLDASSRAARRAGSGALRAVRRTPRPGPAVEGSPAVD